VKYGTYKVGEDVTDPIDERCRFFDDDGTELNPDLIPKPALCISCAKDDACDPEEEILCNLNRLDQQDEPEFKCYAYEPKKGPTQ
jgi:hypothetical protein